MNGPLWIAECDPEQQRAEALRPNITAPARADFEKAWQVFSARRTEADYQAWRDQRDWTAEKYRRFDRGEGMPPGLEAVGRMNTRKNQRFGEPIALPGGGKLFTLKHAIAWLAKEIPQSEHRMKEVQTWRGNLRLGRPSHARRWLA